MGLTKTEGFTKNQLELASMAKALAHPARIAILQFLATEQTCFCGDIVESLPLAQSTVSQHLKELKNAGLIQGDVEGPAVCYCIHDRNWQKARILFADFSKILIQRTAAKKIYF